MKPHTSKPCELKNGSFIWIYRQHKHSKLYLEVDLNKQNLATRLSQVKVSAVIYSQQKEDSDISQGTKRNVFLSHVHVQQAVVERELSNQVGEGACVSSDAQVRSFSSLNHSTADCSRSQSNEGSAGGRLVGEVA